MARIRTIKPEFPHSESVGRMSRDARLLFIQLWTIADDEGRARAAPRLVAGTLYPYDNDVTVELIEGWLDELAREQCIQRYAVGGTQYLQITNWLKHQKIDRGVASRLPAPPDATARGTRDPLASDSRAAREPVATDLGPGPEPGSGPGSGQDQDSAAVAGATRSATLKKFDEFWNEYPRRDGANPRAPAEQKFIGLLARGVKADAIIGGASRYAADLRAKGQDNTPYVAQAVTWLTQKRWQDHQPQKPVDMTGRFYAAAGSPQLEAWDAHARRGGKRGYPRDRNGGWWFEAEWPPDHASVAA
jgi:hypothetical protein